MERQFDLIGVGIGPFHLSLAALLAKVPKVTSLFLDQKAKFHWHPELMFSDADMQTSFLKDLVTPVDPTNPNSFLNYLVQEGLFYSFMNTGRKVVTRKEFELYCQWVSNNLEKNLQFDSGIEEVHYDGSNFLIHTKKEKFKGHHLSVATGLIPRIPECAQPFVGNNVFHAKSHALKDIDLTNKRVIVVGGGQTGLEVFRNVLKNKWGKAKSIRLFSRRQNLEPLDESPFTNEYFNPNYVADFFELDQNLKDPIVKAQKLASDGNTPTYLDDLYNDLYQLQNVEKSDVEFKILPQRSLTAVEKNGNSFHAIFDNHFLGLKESVEADIIILSTGFMMAAPKILDPIKHLLNYDSEGRLIINRNFDISWKGSPNNKIFALNFSRHRHGIAEPQTSLMAWRSASIINNLLNEEFYKNNNVAPSFVHYGKI